MSSGPGGGGGSSALTSDGYVKNFSTFCFAGRVTLKQALRLGTVIVVTRTITIRQCFGAFGNSGIIDVIWRLQKRWPVATETSGEGEAGGMLASLIGFGLRGLEAPAAARNLAPL